MLLVKNGSGVEETTVATLVSVLARVIVATTCIHAELPGAKFPRLHTIVPPELVNDPCEEPMLLIVTSSGSWLVMKSEVAGPGPALVTRLVKVTCWLVISAAGVGSWVR